MDNIGIELIIGGGVALAVVIGLIAFFLMRRTDSSGVDERLESIENYDDFDDFMVGYQEAQAEAEADLSDSQVNY